MNFFLNPEAILHELIINKHAILWFTNIIDFILFMEDKYK